MFESGVSSTEDHTILSLVELIYEAAGDAALWPTVLERIGSAVRSDHASISIARCDRMSTAVPAVLRSSPGHPRAEEFELDSGDPPAERCSDSFPAGTVRYTCPRSNHAAPGIHDVCYHKGHKNSCRLGLRLPLDGDPSAALILSRLPHDRHFDDNDGNVLKQLAPHLRRSLRLYLSAEQVKSLAANLKHALDAVDHAVFGLNRRGAVICSNFHAECVAHAADGLELADGRLIASFPEDNTMLQFSIVRTISNNKGVPAFRTPSLLLKRKSNGPPLQVTMALVPSVQLAGHARLAALVHVIDPAQQSESCARLLRERYGLTPAECRLADLLRQGFEVREAATELGTTLETARFHLKRVLAKTGTRRQAELMRVMLSLSGS